MLSKLLPIFFLCFFSQIARADRDFRTDGQIISAMAGYNFAQARSDLGTWIVAEVSLDDPKTYKFVQSPPGDLNENDVVYLVKQGKLKVKSVVKGNVEVSDIPFQAKKLAARSGSGFVYKSSIDDKYENYIQDGILLCKVEQEKGRYEITSNLPIPPEWQDDATAYFSGKDVTANNHFDVCCKFKQEYTSSDLSDKKFFASLSNLLLSHDYWEVAYSTQVCIEKSNGTDDNSIMGFLKSKVDDHKIGNPDGMCLSLAYYTLLLRSSTTPSSTHKLLQVRQVLSLLNSAYGNKGLSGYSAKIVRTVLMMVR